MLRLVLRQSVSLAAGLAIITVELASKGAKDLAQKVVEKLSERNR